jgi:AcrR family transcriptional regulator
MTEVKNPIQGAGQARRARALATRRRMVEAAYHHFADYGYAVPMDGIARAARVAVQTLYFTFHTKGELLKATVAFAVSDVPTARNRTLIITQCAVPPLAHGGACAAPRWR